MIELRRCLSDLQVCFFRIAKANKEKSYESYQAELALYVSVYLSDLFMFMIGQIVVYLTDLSTTFLTLATV